MDQKERDAQRALGHMEEFRVTMMIPIKVNVRMAQNVEAINEEDAIEKAKMIHDIIPDNHLLQDVISKVSKGFGNKVEFDTTVERKYEAQQMSKPKKGMLFGMHNEGDSCGSSG